MSEFIVEFDYIYVKHIAELQKFKHFKHWFGVCIYRLQAIIRILYNTLFSR